MNRAVSDVRMVDGLNRIMIGYCKKVILADTFGEGGIFHWEHGSESNCISR